VNNPTINKKWWSTLHHVLYLNLDSKITQKNIIIVEKVKSRCFATNGLNSSFNSRLIKPKNPITATGIEHQKPNFMLNEPALATIFSPLKFPYSSNKVPVTKRPIGK
jgi:hypothetical protein